MSSWNPLEVLASSLAQSLDFGLPSMRFLLTIFFGYPIAIFYLIFIRKRPEPIHHLFIVLTGLILLLWNFGQDVVHLLIGIASTMATLQIFGPTNISVGLCSILNMGYLLTGCYMLNYGTYDINWTMPYCILCLRLIGFAWDYRDGSLPTEDLSEYQKAAAFQQLPTFVEVLSFCFVPNTCFAGPQFTWHHYQSFIKQTLRPEIVVKNRNFMQKYIYNPKLHRTASRFLSGIFCMVINIVATKYLPMDYMLTDEFLIDSNFLHRLIYMGLFTNFLILRYLAIWLIGEGSCVLMGLGCTGRIKVQYKSSDTSADPLNDPSIFQKTVHPAPRKTAILSSADSTSDYDMKELEEAVRLGKAVVTEADHTRCANISIIRFALATNSDLLVSSFNINTNKWILEYCYKRLKFLGNKNLSQLLSLIFLALWHGLYSGYYVNFFLEFISIYAEREFLAIVRKSIFSDFLYETFPGKVLSTVIGRLHICFMLTSPLVAFAMLRASLWIPVFSSVYFVGFIYLLWPFARPLVKLLFPPKILKSFTSTSNADIQK